MRNNVYVSQLLPLIFITLVSITGCTATHTTAAPAEPASYEPSATVQQDIDALLDTAKANNHHAMIVLGANWCHDSTGLAEKFASPAMQTVLNAHYETLFVDVAYLEDRRDVTTRFGYPTYFATPTVLIVDPDTGTLVNYDSIARWGSADSIPLTDYTAYFTAHADKHGEALSEAQRQALAPLDAFTEKQITRLHAGYAHLGPMLAAYEAGEREGPFIDTWKEVKGFRTQLQKDIHQLRTAMLFGGEDVTFPDYGPFSWE
ncbi:thioredoxin family protein [Alteromonas sp. CYL-A6]|uniref:thioredoxin family protein n=1 Tax=Alteromonas nitratireducens TaxID=3390813 RepID=UPI0034BE92C3